MTEALLEHEPKEATSGTFVAWGEFQPGTILYHKPTMMYYLVARHHRDFLLKHGSYPLVPLCCTDLRGYTMQDMLSTVSHLDVACEGSRWFVVNARVKEPGENEIVPLAEPIYDVLFDFEGLGALVTESVGFLIDDKRWGVLLKAQLVDPQDEDEYFMGVMRTYTPKWWGLRLAAHEASYSLQRLLTQFPIYLVDPEGKRHGYRPRR